MPLKTKMSLVTIFGGAVIALGLTTTPVTLSSTPPPDNSDGALLSLNPPIHYNMPAQARLACILNGKAYKGYGEAYVSDIEGCKATLLTGARYTPQKVRINYDPVH